MRRLLSLLIVLMLVVSACSDRQPLPEQPTAPPSVPAGSVRVDGAGSADVQVRDVGQEASPSPQFTYASHTFELTPSGPRASTTVQLVLTSPLPAGFGAAVATRESPDQPWTYLSATLSADRASVTFTTTHFSLFSAVGLDLPDIARTFKTDFLDGLASGALRNDIPKPKCDDEAAARHDGYKITSTTKIDTVYWCFGIEHGRRVLKVTDHRRYPLLISHSNMATLDNEIDKFELSSLSHLGSRRKTVVGPGNTVTYNADLQPGDSEGAATEMDGTGQSLYALQVGIETLFGILTKFGGSDIARLTASQARAKQLRLLNGLVGSRSCLAALGKTGGDVLRGCFDADLLVEGLGSAALLIVPIFIVGGLLSFGRAEWNALIDAATNHDKYKIVIVRTKAAVDILLPATRAAADMVDGRDVRRGSFVYDYTDGPTKASVTCRGGRTTLTSGSSNICDVVAGNGFFVAVRVLNGQSGPDVDTETYVGGDRCEEIETWARRAFHANPRPPYGLDC